ncbi:MAG TPA: adenosylhomocysteinase [Candidatus Kapabacteria bacterium]|nr:adenosylhomocysteinase [Candidatus Kapabacteria bacterium]
MYSELKTKEKLYYKEGEYCIRDISLASDGRKLIEWAEAHMPVLMKLRDEYSKSRPFEGYTIAGSLHVTKETAVLIETLMAAGAKISWSGCNPLSTNDAVAAALVERGASVYAWYSNFDDYYWCIEQTIKNKPNLVLDDGADLITTLHQHHPDFSKTLIGGTEETTTGVHRLRKRGEAGELLFPVYAVNDVETKWDFDNVYGTGQSTIDGILRATSVLLAGKKFVVAGYGHCGKGVAMRAKGLGSDTIITEVKPTAALKALLEGHNAMTMDEASEIGDIFVTATGVKDVIRKWHFEKMKDGAIICNTGHFDVEINVPELEELTVSKREIRPNCEEYTLKNGRRIYLLAQGRLVNLASAEGHPSEVMDMSFANQFLSQLRLLENHKKGVKLPNLCIDLPEEQDEQVGRLKLESMNIKIDHLTEEQIHYINDFNAGT